MEAKVGIVLVNYNGEKFQNDCIRTIKEMTYRNYEIFVVDNNSKDQSIKTLKEKYSDVNIIETGENCGVAKGNNIGIKKALENGCEYILLLNNDTEVDKEMLSNLIKKSNKNTLVTCKMYFFNNKEKIWCAGGKIDWSKATTVHFGENEIDDGSNDRSRYVEYTPTCCLLIHKGVFENIGLMDEKYFMYYDDADFVVRANKVGYKVWYESNAKLWHKVSSSSGGSESKIILYYANRNRLYFINKFYKSKLRVLIYYYLTRITKCIKYSFVSRELAKIIIKSIYDYKNDRMYLQNLNNK
ncbi:MAG: glycosyltransferase family 2 protein [Clostridium sp.]|uniref:glycosyltransferase family 2 protein n=1 Tax=Clostridium sp. TaxID=1506 RepID=UPI003D6D4295